MIRITIGLPGLLDIIWHMHCFKGVWDHAGAFAANLLRPSQSCGWEWHRTGAFAADLPRPSQSSGHKLFKCMHGSREFGMGLTNYFNYFMSLTRPGQVVQHDQWYFVCVSSQGTLWMNDSVERGYKIKIIHDQGDGMNSPGVGVGGPERQKLCTWWWELIPHHQAEKAFHFFELSTGWQITSESTVERDHCNVTCWSICVKFLLNTSNWRCWELIKSVQGGLRVRSGVQGNDLKNIIKLTPKILLLQGFYGNGL